MTDDRRSPEEKAEDARHDALSLATRGNTTDTPEQVIRRAAAYLDWLTGKDDLGGAP